MRAGVEPEFIRAIVAAENGRNLAQKRELEERRRELGAEARRLVPLLLAADPAIVSISLFGSVLPNRPLRRDSDVDLLVQGATRFADLLRVAEASEYPVDLVEWETLSSSLQGVIEKDAAVLYGASQTCCAA